MPTMTPSLPSILLQRFLINLRRADLEHVPADASRVSQFSIPAFRVPTIDGVVGNLGEPLIFGSPEEIDD